MSMTTFAALFPGQGSQYVGMGARYQQAPIGRGVYDRADATLGFSLSRLSVEGPQAELTLTANAQPALVAHSYASLLALGETRTERLTPKCSAGAGYSLGE